MSESVVSKEKGRGEFAPWGTLAGLGTAVGLRTSGLWNEVLLASGGDAVERPKMHRTVPFPSSREPQIELDVSSSLVERRWSKCFSWEGGPWS